MKRNGGVGFAIVLGEGPFPRPCFDQRFAEICRRKINRLAESCESRYLWAAFESMAPPAAFY